MMLAIRIIVTLILSINITSLCLASEEIPLTVPPLVKNQPDIRSIYRIGNDIIVRTEKWVYKEHKYYHSLWRMHNGSFVPYISKIGNPVVAVSEGSLHELIASYKDKNVLLEFADQPDRDIKVCVRVEPPFLLGANDSFSFLIFSNRIVEVSKKGIIRIVFLKGLVPGKFRMLPRAICVSEKELILGYDKGEFGGLAISFKITENGISDKAVQLLSENVCSIVHGSNGKIWIACGLSHLGIERAGLYSYDGSNITKIVSQKGFMGKVDKVQNKGKVNLPGSTEISGITFTPNGDVVVLAGQIGLLSYSHDNSFKFLWKGSAFTIFSEPGFKVINYPIGIIEKEGDLYMATERLGVILFKKPIDKKMYIPIKQIYFSKIK